VKAPWIQKSLVPNYVSERSGELAKAGKTPLGMRIFRVAHATDPIGCAAAGAGGSRLNMDFSTAVQDAQKFFFSFVHISNLYHQILP
jgi:hypothetical protein